MNNAETNLLGFYRESTKEDVIRALANYICVTDDKIEKLSSVIFDQERKIDELKQDVICTKTQKNSLCKSIKLYCDNLKIDLDKVYNAVRCADIDLNDTEKINSIVEHIDTTPNLDGDIQIRRE